MDSERQEGRVAGTKASTRWCVRTIHSDSTLTCSVSLRNEATPDSPTASRESSPTRAAEKSRTSRCRWCGKAAIARSSHDGLQRRGLHARPPKGRALVGGVLSGRVTLRQVPDRGVDANKGRHGECLVLHCLKKTALRPVIRLLTARVSDSFPAPDGVSGFGTSQETTLTPLPSAETDVLKRLLFGLNV